MINVDYDKLKRYVAKIGTYYINGRLNIIGIRNSNQIAGKFDDTLCIMNNNLTFVNSFEVTTDPSDVALVNMKNNKGVAIVKANTFHKDLWSLGFHKSDPNHHALIQVKPIVVIRDFNKDNKLNWDVISSFDTVKENTKLGIIEYFKSGKLIRREEIGFFGINCHRASAWKISELVGLYSEGCTVHKNPNRYNKEFIPAVKEYSNICTKFSYIIVNQAEYERY